MGASPDGMLHHVRCLGTPCLAGCIIVHHRCTQAVKKKQPDEKAAAAQLDAEELTAIEDPARFQSEPDFWEGEGWEVRARRRRPTLKRERSGTVHMLPPLTGSSRPR